MKYLIDYLHIYLFPGFIRNVDPDKKIFYVLTPEPMTVLSQVNALIKGNNIDISSILLNQVREPKFAFQEIYTVLKSLGPSSNFIDFLSVSSKSKQDHSHSETMRHRGTK